jgi:S-adenosylmethionine:tRNA ribosyltransferase-isomerase
VRRDLFDYQLPVELIASHPPPERDGGRLLVVSGSGSSEHANIRELDRFVPDGALVVVNDTRVIPARLIGRKRTTGGRVELLLVRRLASESAHDGDASAQRWQALGKASKPLRRGALLAFGDDLLARVEEPHDSNGVTPAVLEVTLRCPSGRSVAAALEAIGRTPLPPYIRREDDALDRERYQTIYAEVPGAVAAPTAGLHLSRRVLDRLATRHVELASITLHVGLGTFQPVTADDLDDHSMHAESFVVPPAAVDAIHRARRRGAPLVAIGTTVVRALESASDPQRIGFARPTSGDTSLLIQPGYSFRVVDALLTNFHLPRSTLLALVCAFAGRERVMAAYRQAIEARYRFYSYGDAMLITAAARGVTSGEA